MTEKDLPPLRTRVSNALVAGQKIVSAALRGNKLAASGETQVSRMHACNNCEYFRRSDRTCSKCGCSIDSKIALATESCPDGHWHSVSRRPKDGDAVADGWVLLEIEQELRNILEVDSQLVKLFNEYQIDTQAGGCSSCRKRRYIKLFERALGVDIAKMDMRQKKMLKDALIHFVYVNTPGPVLIDDLIGEK